LGIRTRYLKTNSKGVIERSDVPHLSLINALYLRVKGTVARNNIF
jgi:hypothetical protein